MMKQVKAAAVMVMLGMSFVLGAEEKLADAEALSARPQPTKDSSEPQYNRETAIQLSSEASDKGWVLLFQDHNKIKAMDEFNKAWRLDPDNFLPYWGSGIIYRMTADEKGSLGEQYLKDSIKLLEKSRELVIADAAKRNVTLDLAYTYNKAGIFYLNRDSKEQADLYFAKSEKLLLEIIKTDPSFGEAHYLLSTVFFYKHDFCPAVKEAELAEKNGFALPDDFKRQIQKYAPPGELKTDDSKDNNRYGLLLLPVNLAPDIVADTVLCYGKGVSLFFEYPDEPAWGAMMLIYAPFSGIYHGLADAAEGYPFWSVYLLRSDNFSPFSRDGQK